MRIFLQLIRVRLKLSQLPKIYLERRIWAHHQEGGHQAGRRVDHQESIRRNIFSNSKLYRFNNRIMCKIRQIRLLGQRAEDRLLKCNTTWETWISLLRRLKRIFLTNLTKWISKISTACQQLQLPFLKRLRIKWRHLPRIKRLRLKCQIHALTLRKYWAHWIHTTARVWESLLQIQQREVKVTIQEQKLIAKLVADLTYYIQVNTF